jgi:CDP-diacylglycerol--glycerol-3-phosphate 3-phosphatidyltransferase/cardiolipin synthase
MTVPNLITLFRFLLIPVFAGALLYYQESFRGGSPNPMYWVWALGAFVAAALSDAVDGAIARVFNQRSRLGAIMDPLADKALVVTALIMLSWVKTDMPGLPIWFVVLVLSRDVLLVIAIIGLQVFVRHIAIQPHWTGKLSTALIMGLISMVLLKSPSFWVEWVAVLGGLATLGSIGVYLVRGIQAVSASGFDQPPQHPRRPYSP